MRPDVRRGVVGGGALASALESAAKAVDERVAVGRDDFSFCFSLRSGLSEALSSFSDFASDFSAFVSGFSALASDVSADSAEASSIRVSSSGAISSASRSEVKPEPSLLRGMEIEPLKPAGLAVLIVR